MKIRNGFVSNSSSSSFVVALSVLTEEERNKILSYGEYAEKSTDCCLDDWTITEVKEKGVISGYTIMDNSDLSEYLGKELSSKFTFEWDD